MGIIMIMASAAMLGARGQRFRDLGYLAAGCVLVAIYIAVRANRYQGSCKKRRYYRDGHNHRAGGENIHSSIANIRSCWTSV
jgi:hypothetical protein